MGHTIKDIGSMIKYMEKVKKYILIALCIQENILMERNKAMENLY